MAQAGGKRVSADEPLRAGNENRAAHVGPAT
jgi:hypothetical protein